ncbi:MAG: peptide chain release factor N(5)-glutamine methyltransferase [Yoonia sp.]|uniref:peptide chain release factor N(5)-glutamine methyltransferase n=2 Tax=Yoonia sp. TaxID=2212373 RepID=UPI003299F558
MSGFFAEGTFWDVNGTQDAAIRDAAKRLGFDGALGEVQRLWAVAAGNLTTFDALVAQRADHVPLSHLLGYRDFYKHRFIVTADVLDPRPDTETLIEAALAVPFTRVLDLGTGSGCILLSLLGDRPDATGVGTDLSDAALAVAGRNAAALDLQSRATFLQSDWFADVAGSFDLIVSNPPYIAADEMAGLQADVRDHEPRMALTDEADGLTCYRIIANGAHAALNTDGHLMVEIGPTQGAAVAEMFAANGFAKIQVTQDLDGRDRVVFGQKSGG